MEIYSVVLFSSLLLLTSVAMTVWQVRSWKIFQKDQSDAEEFDYRRRQFRRRMQTSAMLGLLAVAMFLGYVLTFWFESDWFVLAFWCVLMIMLCWVVLLAVVDIWATRHHYGRLRHGYMVEKVKLEHELRRIQAVQGNGKGKVQGNKSRTKDGNSASDE